VPESERVIKAEYETEIALVNASNGLSRVHKELVDRGQDPEVPFCAVFSPRRLVEPTTVVYAWAIPDYDCSL
jgi:hypothetical protein